MDRREKQAIGKGMTFAKPSMGRERRGGCGKQDGGQEGGCVTPEGLLCSPEVAVCGGPFWDTEATQV